jgi:O-antigen/teichoic acid export membrane protein
MESYRNLFQKTKRLTGLDLGFFLKSSFWITISQIAGSLAGIVITLSFVHLGTKILYGQYNLLLSLLGLISILTLPDLGTAITESVSKGYDQSLNKGYKIKFLASLVAVLGTIFLGIYYLFNNRIIGETLLFISFFLPFYFSPTVFSNFLSAKKNFKTLAKYRSFLSIATALFFVTTLLVFKNIKYIFFFYVVLTALLNIIFYKKTKKFIINKKEDKNLASYGFFLTKLSIISRMASYLDQVLLSGFLGVESLALYAAALKIPTAIKKQILAYGSPLVVKIAHFNEERAAKAVKDHFLKMIFIGFLIAFVMWVSIPLVYKLLFTADYYEAIKYARILSLSYFFEPVNMLFASFFKMHKRQKEMIFFSIFMPIIQIASYFILIPLFGILGLILIQLLQNFLYFLVSFKIIVLKNNKN